MVTLYSTGCPRCKILAKRLDAANVSYTINDNMEDIEKVCEEIGTDMVPILAVEELGEGETLMKFTYMDFENAMKWAGEQTNAV